MPQSRSLSLPLTKHGLIVGNTGSGKSTLAQLLLQQWRDRQSTIVIDPKGLFWPGEGYELIRDPKQLSRKTGNILYRPTGKHNNQKTYDEVFEWIYRRRNTQLYIDELVAVSGNTFTEFPYWLKQLYHQGRGLGITILGVSQRPSGMPRTVFTESFAFWKFRLLERDDQVRMAQVMGPQVIEPPDYPDHSAHPTRHSYWYRDLDSDRATLHEIKLI